MPETPEIYIDAETYRRLVAELVNMQPSFFTGDRETRTHLALGEIANIWPDSIRPDACVRT